MERIVEAQALGRTADGTARIQRRVPDEVAVELRYNGTAHATMMASPADLADFAVGFTLTEAIAPYAGAIGEVRQGDHCEGLVLDIALHGAAFAALLRSGKRLMPGRSGCGVCGVRTLEDARGSLPMAASGPQVSQTAIASALGRLPRRHGLHGAAFCDADGQVLLVREDIGRHNALDKLIGAMARGAARHAAADGFCLITSRCSHEMVQKAVRGGFASLVAVSSPTGLALDTARQAGLRVIALAGHQESTLFCEPAAAAPPMRLVAPA